MTVSDLPTAADAARPPIEQILLARGRRGMDRLARHLPPDYCARAARAAWAARARVLLTTGFWVAGHPETDGPPGAFFLARGLARAGAQVGFVAEDEALGMLDGLARAMWPAGVTPPEFVPFPLLDAVASDAFAADLAARRQPSLVVAVERCGRTASGRYLNMRGGDITAHTAQVDALLAAPGAATIGIGDGGNEIGMGVLASVITTELDMPAPCVTPVAHLVVATVSNWGAYGLLAYLSGMAGADLLPSVDESRAALDLLVGLGAIHGMTGRAEAMVDGFSPADEAAVLAELRAAMG